MALYLINPKSKLLNVLKIADGIATRCSAWYWSFQELDFSTLRFKGFRRHLLDQIAIPADAYFALVVRMELCRF